MGNGKWRNEEEIKIGDWGMEEMREWRDKENEEEIKIGDWGMGNGEMKWRSRLGIGEWRDGGMDSRGVVWFLSRSLSPPLYLLMIVSFYNNTNKRK